MFYQKKKKKEVTEAERREEQRNGMKCEENKCKWMNGPKCVFQINLPTLSMWNDPDVYLPSEFTEASNKPHIVINRHWDYGD